MNKQEAISEVKNYIEALDPSVKDFNISDNIYSEMVDKLTDYGMFILNAGKYTKTEYNPLNSFNYDLCKNFYNGEFYVEIKNKGN